jgi:hypothetical protein
MLNKILIITLIVSINSILSLKSIDLCYSIDSICKGNYNYKCTKDICSLNKNTCYSYYSNFIGYQEFRSLKYVTLIHKNIKACEYKLNLQDYCLKMTKCSKSNPIVWSPFNYYSQLIVTNCKCEGMHSFECGRFCTLSKKYCDLIQIKIKKNGTNKFEAELCY